MMKRFTFITAMFLMGLAANAQTTKTGADYFVGKWDVVVKDTPNGDAKMVFTFAKKDAGLSGTISMDPSGKDAAPVTNVIVSADYITVYFTAQGYDVSMTLKGTDDDHVSGSLLDMFSVTGSRIKM